MKKVMMKMTRRKKVIMTTLTKMMKIKQIQSMMTKKMRVKAKAL
jgi:hypothetical protein